MLNIMNIHMHLAPVKSPWLGEALELQGLSLIQGKPGTRERWGFLPRRSQPLLAAFRAQQKHHKKRHNKNNVCMIPAQDIISPSSPCPTVFWTTAAPTTLLELCVGLSCLCLQWAKAKLITRDSCRHGRDSANIQAVFLMISFLCHERRMRDLKPSWSTVYLTLGSAAMLEMLKLQVGRHRQLPFGECKMTFWLLLTTSQIVLALLLMQFESLQCFLFIWEQYKWWPSLEGRCKL